MIHTGEKLYKCVGRYSLGLAHWRDIWWLTQIISHINATFVGRHYYSQLSEDALRVRTHSDDKPYKCDSCTFFVSGHMKTHVMTHTGERPYNVISVGKHLFSPLIWSHTWRFTQVRSHKNVTFVERHSLDPAIWRCIWVLTQVKSHMCVALVHSFSFFN